MAKSTLMQDRLVGVRDALGARLDTVQALVPDPKPPKVPMPEYLQRAIDVAAGDPQFKERLDVALKQYQAGAALVKRSGQDGR